MFDFGKNKNKSNAGDGKGPDYSWPQQDEVVALIRNESHESIKQLGAWSYARINSEMRDIVDVHTTLAAAELAVQHPNLDVIESAIKKFDDLRNRGLNGLSEDEREIAE